MTACVVCPSETPNEPLPGYAVCGHCKRNLAANLTELVDLYALTESELTPGSGGNGRGNERPIGLRVSALNALAGHDLLGTLGSWEQDWRETFNLAPPPTRFRYVDVIGGYMRRSMPVQATLLEMVTFLSAWLDHACRYHPAIDEFDREVREIHAALRTAARMQSPPSWTVDCPADDCGRRLRLTSDLDDRVDCRGCGTSWTVYRLLVVAVADSSAEIWLDPTAVCTLTGIPERTLRRWAQGGIITRDHGRYALGSVRTAMLGGVG